MTLIGEKNWSQEEIFWSSSTWYNYPKNVVLTCKSFLLVSLALTKFWFGQLVIGHDFLACALFFLCWRGAALLVEAANMGDPEAQYELACHLRVGVSTFIWLFMAKSCAMYLSWWAFVWESFFKRVNLILMTFFFKNPLTAWELLIWSASFLLFGEGSGPGRSHWERCILSIYR